MKDCRKHLVLIISISVALQLLGCGAKQETKVYESIRVGMPTEDALSLLEALLPETPPNDRDSDIAKITLTYKKGLALTPNAPLALSSESFFIPPTTASSNIKGNINRIEMIEWEKGANSILVKCEAGKVASKTQSK